jgi:hypothetical protein
LDRSPADADRAQALDSTSGDLYQQRMLARPGGSRNGEGIPRAWPLSSSTGKTATEGAPGPPQDLKGFLTNDLIDYCSCRDKERIGKMARHWT